MSVPPDQQAEPPARAVTPVCRRPGGSSTRATATRCGNAVYARHRTAMPRRATTQNFSPAILGLDAALRSGRLAHDGSPVLAWCIGNVVGQEDRRGNLFPAKVRENKIDAAVALMMAIGRAQASEVDPQPAISAFLTDPLFA
jgi:hypothetical protein